MLAFQQVEPRKAASIGEQTLLSLAYATVTAPLWSKVLNNSYLLLISTTLAQPLFVSVLSVTMETILHFFIRKLHVKLCPGHWSSDWLTKWLWV